MEIITRILTKEIVKISLRMKPTYTMLSLDIHLMKSCMKSTLMESTGTLSLALC